MSALACSIRGRRRRMFCRPAVSRGRTIRTRSPGPNGSRAASSTEATNSLLRSNRSPDGTCSGPAISIRWTANSDRSRSGMPSVVRAGQVHSSTTPSVVWRALRIGRTLGDVQQRRQWRANRIRSRAREGRMSLPRRADRSARKNARSPCRRHLKTRTRFSLRRA